MENECDPLNSCAIYLAAVNHTYHGGNAKCVSINTPVLALAPIDGAKGYAARCKARETIWRARCELKMGTVGGGGGGGSDADSGNGE